MKWVGIPFALALVPLLISPAGAQDNSLQLTTEAFQEIEVKDEEGNVTIKTVPVAKVIPGTEVMYAITYRNDAAGPATDVVITNPVPSELEYTADSAFGSGTRIEVSVNGGKDWGELSALTVVGEDGEPRPAEGRDVTSVRWTLEFPVQPGDQGRVTYRARLK